MKGLIQVLSCVMWVWSGQTIFVIVESHHNTLHYHSVIPSIQLLEGYSSRLSVMVWILKIVDVAI